MLYSTLRYLLALAAQYKLAIFHLDVETAFLNGELEEEIDAFQPEGCKSAKYPDKVIKLNKALYGLKQGSRTWNIKLKEILIIMNFIQLKTDRCVYILEHTIDHDTKQLILGTYVDDLILITNSAYLKKIVLDKHKKQLSMRDLRELKYFLNIDINYDKEKGILELIQTNYIKSLLKKFNMPECSHRATPLDPFQKLSKYTQIEDSSQDKTPNFPYQEAVGSILYLSQTTRPDITHAVNMLSKYNNCYSNEHVNAVKHLLKYLQSMKEAKLSLTKKSGRLIGFSDANFANDLHDRKSTSGYIFYLYNFPISWKSKKQKCVSTSTCQPEQIALASACEEAINLRNLSSELDCVIIQEATPIYFDKQGALSFAKDLNSAPNLRHIDICYIEAKDFVERNIIEPRYINTNENIADIFTKSLQGRKHRFLSAAMGLCFPEAID